MSQQDVVVITGSTGFIGSALVKNLTGRFELVGFDRIASRSPPPAAECVCIDLTSELGVNAAFERVRIAYGERIAAVIHLAAYYDLSGEASPFYEQITVRGTERLLRHLQQFQVEQFIFSSTMLVHAPSEPGRRINEDSPIDPRWPYPLSKVETEALIREKHGDIPVVLLRLAGVYDDQGHSAFLTQQIARIYERRLLGHLYPGDTRRGQAFIHIDDVMQVLSRLIEKRRKLPKELVLLAGEPETLSYEEVQRTVGRLLHGEDWETREIPKALAKSGAWIEDTVLEEDPFIKPWMVDVADDHYELDITRARTLLEWEPKHSLRETLPRIVAALNRDPSGWYRTNKLNPSLVEGHTAARIQPTKPSDAHEAIQAVPTGHPVSQEHDGTSSSAAGRHRNPTAAAKASDSNETADRMLAERSTLREHEDMMLGQHRQTLWAHFANVALGAWLVTSPIVIGLFDQTAFAEAVQRVAVERGLPPPEWRNLALAYSDIVSGALIILFGLLSLQRRTNWAQWANTGVGLWLLFAPLVFWAPTAASYLNDTLIGALVITFSVIVPMMPGMSMEGMMGGPDIPPGWTYSPSTYAQRLPIIAMGVVGFLIARYLAAYQLGHIESVWDPFFRGLSPDKNGTETIITSSVSKAWPIPDGGLGAVSYMLEVLMGVMGDKRRWRTMPWMVTFFGMLVVPLGVVSIYFIIIQPIVIGTWCALCLLAALAMLIMIPFSLDELVAMGQFLIWSRREGKSLWRVFLTGGALEGGRQDTETDLGSFSLTVTNMVRGLTIPWTLILSAVLGVWLMFTRLTFGTVPPIANSDHLMGALVVTTAIISMAEVARPLRFFNLLFGLWLISTPWMMAGGSGIARWADAAVGVGVLVLSLPRGTRSGAHYASWDRFVV